MKSTDEPVVVEQDFATSIDELWRAITDLSEMQQWFFGEAPAFEPTTGFETSFLIEFDGEAFVHQWKIVDVIEKEKIVYEWTYKDRPGCGIVTWQLSEIPSGTRLTLTNDVVESFPDEIPAFRRESCEAGWKYFINERLVDHLA